ncbi:MULTISPECIES: DUF2268 domain-containing protein [Sutcliffiella]|uniref:Zn-dependent protease n=1 Tax=Sutcliffiella cohnii TaxID=33932 RepID=A0A223KMJ7_9BACI|nr:MULTISPECIES: DUF2268 domain-containing putative Zn-dependent protease [Sutcliffiella]AST90588.1 Zn-dependent protease [Sutcliffiella cohnii]WBL16240.1 DUF2268 domain-containing putative Zn-dependent protease [Sutcliffiella sp. NC1]
MPIIQTDKWLQQDYFEPLKLCKRLLLFFEDVTDKELYDYLRSHGMYCPVRGGLETIDSLKEKDVWGIVQEAYKELKKKWNGPTIPVFIFPSDVYNREIQKDFNGKSGVAFKDKLFLFLPEHINKNELKALLTHEYNHICVLRREKKKEDEYTFFDSILIEGLAESAVKDQLGEAYVSKWTNYYNNETCNKYYLQFVVPNLHVKNYEKEHMNLLYGKRGYPKMLGYCIGYYLIQNTLKTSKLPYQKLLSLQLDDLKKIIKRYNP